MGSDFPFVMLVFGLLGLHELGEFRLSWVLMDVPWATLGGCHWRHLRYFAGSPGMEAAMTPIVVTLSILLHGISVKPLMGYFWQRNKQISTP